MQFTWLVATEITQKQVWIVLTFLLLSTFAIVGIFSAFFVKMGFRDYMDLWWKWSRHGVFEFAKETTNNFWQ